MEDTPTKIIGIEKGDFIWISIEETYRIAIVEKPVPTEKLVMNSL